eukprot:gb/GECH01004369.1/.p1 GENE.gb/GECH01004369.1/~~gb/GECH01004369.1/.p1  ORF type:complete len:218 (+),score=7.43 gb/GECH01004369.1/:1-654(+)
MLKPSVTMVNCPQAQIDDVFVSNANNTRSTLNATSEEEPLFKTFTLRNQLLKPMVSRKEVKFEDLANYFIYPLAPAASKMGVSPSHLKRLCRRVGIARWPYRQLKRLASKVIHKGCTVDNEWRRVVRGSVTFPIAMERMDSLKDIIIHHYRSNSIAKKRQKQQTPSQPLKLEPTMPKNTSNSSSGSVPTNKISISALVHDTSSNEPFGFNSTPNSTP